MLNFCINIFLKSLEWTKCKKKTFTSNFCYWFFPERLYLIMVRSFDMKLLKKAIAFAFLSILMLPVFSGEKNLLRTKNRSLSMTAPQWNLLKK